MEKQIKEAIEIINKVRETMPECTNKAFLKGALNELNEALSKAKVFSSNDVLADSLPPSELIALKEYYDKIWKGAGGGCKSQGYYDAIKISEAIEKRLADMAVNLR